MGFRLDDLVKYRLAAAAERLKSSEILYSNGQWKDSIGRSYYATRALLATRLVDFARHTGVIQYFHKEFVKTGEFDPRFGKILDTAFQIRNNCDYNDFSLVSSADAAFQLQNAKDFLQMGITYLDSEQ